MQEVRDLLIRIRSDSTGLDKGIGSAESAFSKLNISAKGVAIGITAVTAATAALIKAIDRGQVVSELSTAFGTLQKQAGGSVAALDQLKAATGGLIDNLDLMRASNQALLSDLTPEQFLDLAKAADTLGDAVGKNTKQALDELVSAVSTGNERLLKSYGIVIDNAKAERDFAKSIGSTADKLNELGKKEAARLALMDATREKTKQLGSGTETAGDQMQKLGTAFSNSLSYMTQWINESPNLIAALKSIVGLAENASNVFRYLFSADDVAKLGRAQNELIASQEKTQQLAAALSRGDKVEGVGSDIYFGRKAILEAYNKAQAETNKLTFEYNGLLTKLQKPHDDNAKATGKNKDAYIDAAKGIAELNKQLNEQKLNLDQLSQSSSLNSLEKSLSTAFGTANFQSTLSDYKSKLYEVTWQSVYTAHKEAIDSSANYRLKAEQITQEEVSSLVKEKILEDEEARKEAFQNSVDFYADILTTTITGTAQDLEDILKDALKRVAIGFGSQLLASILPISGSITSAQGLGQALAASIFPSAGGGASSGFGGLIGSAGAGGLGALAANSGILSFGGIAGGVGGAAVGAGQISGISNALKGKNLNFLQELSLGTITGGASFLIDPIKSFFGGDSQKAQERVNREDLLNKIFGDNLSFQGVGGLKTLSSKNFNVDQSGLGGKAVGLLSGLSDVIAGGDNKLGDDLAGIFANATKEGENFNEVLINAQALLQKTGYSAEQAKSELENLFLDGKITLDEYNVGLEGFDILMKKNLEGINATADAIKVINNELTIPRIKIQAIALAFNEMAEDGIDSASEIHNYLTENFSPEIVEAFDKILTSGIDTFDEVWQNVGIVANAFELGQAAVTEYAQSFEQISTTANKSAADAKKAIKDTAIEAEKQGTKIRNALNIRARISIDSSSDINPPLNGRPA